MNSKLPPAVFKENVTGRLKWFNKTKGYGFVTIEGEDGDAFMHATQVAVESIKDLNPGTTLVCDLAKSARGLVVATIHSLDGSTGVPEHSGGHAGDNGGSSGASDAPMDLNMADKADLETVEGILKFYNANSGYGFMLPDGGSEDVFLPGRVIVAAGLRNLQPDTRIRVEARRSVKGLQAESIELIQS